MRLTSDPEIEALHSFPSPLSELRRTLGAQVALNVPLADLSRWRIGGPADAIITPKNRDSLATALFFLKRHDIRYVVVGDCSNLLFDDAGYRGAVIRIGRAFDAFTLYDDGVVHAGAGMWVPAFARRLISAGWAGAEHVIGIPGTLGGLVVMNGGSNRRSIGEIVCGVEVLDADGKIRWLARDDLDLGYRRSALQQSEDVVLSCRFQLTEGDAGALRRDAIAILASRRAKFPTVKQNCGSVFVSDPALYSLIGSPGLAIERAGLKGLSCGDAQISPQHANFIINNGQARSSDILSLISLARQRVEALTGIAMLTEVRYLDPVGQLRPAHDMCVAPLPVGA